MNEKDLLAAVIAAPQDDQPRLAYADWCDEHDPSRAEFIRVECEIEKLSKNDPRYRLLCSRATQLRDEHQKRWLAPLADLTFFAQFRRGFPETVGIRVEKFAEVAERLFAATPISSISLCCIDIKDYLPSILACPHLHNLRRLSLTGLKLNDEHIVQLAETPYLSNLNTLEIGDNLFGACGVSALVQSPHLTKLTSLSLYKTPLGPEGCKAFAHECRLTELRDLNLYNASVGDAGAVAIASAQLSKLTNLSLGRGVNGNNSLGPSIQDKGAAALANAQHLCSLVQLNLENNYIGDKGAIAIARSENLRSLMQLNLQSNAIGAKGGLALAVAQQFTNLSYLDLTNNILGKEGVQAFASSPLLTHLKHIGLSGNGGLYTDRYVEYADWDGTIVGGGYEMMGASEIHKAFAFPDDVKLF